MKNDRKTIASIAFAAAGSLLAMQAANATCSANMKGTWNFHAIEVGARGSANIITCVVNVAANGMFSNAPCTAYQAASNGTDVVTVDGQFMLSACNLTGSIVIGGSDPDVIIKSGHVNGNLGAGIATQGTGAKTQVLHFTLVKK